MLKGNSITLFVASLACFMVILDTTVANVAIQGIHESLGASVSGLQWVIDGYALSFACTLLSAGAVADRIGPRKSVGFGMAVFTVTSLLCGIAPNLAVLVAARIVQGLGAALLIPSSLALISRTFTLPVERAKALSVWGGIGGGAAMTAGPVVGGLLTGYLGWRSVFLINVPVGIMAVLMLRSVPLDTPAALRRGLDLLGQSAAIIALAATTYVFIEGPSIGWTSLPVEALAVIALASAAAFLRIEDRGKDPMLPLEFFKDRAFSVSTAIGFGLNFAFYGQLFFLNLYLQAQRGVSPQATGLHFLPQAVTGVSFAYLAGRMAHRFSPAHAVSVGMGLGTLGLLLLAAFGLRGSVWTEIVCMALIGVSIGTPASLIAIMLGAVPTERAGMAGGALNAARQAGGLLGVAVLGALVGHGGASSINVALIASAAVMAVSSIGSATILGSMRYAHSGAYSEAVAEAMA